MKEAFENKDSATFLVCELQPGDQLEGVSLRALAHNKLQGFAAASFSQVGDTKYIRYNISGKTPVSRLMGGTMRKKSMLGMLNGIVGAMLSAEANQVAAQTVMLDLNHVFTDPATGETALICMPLTSAQPTKITAAMLCRNLLTNIRLENGEDNSFVGPLLNELNSNPNPPLADLKAALDRAASAVPQQPAAPVQPPVQPQPVSMQQPQPQTDKPMSMFYLLQNYNKENAAAYKTQKAPKQPAAPQYDFAVPGVPQKPAAPVQPPVQPQQPTVPQQPPVQNRPVVPMQPAQPYYPPKPAAPQNVPYGYPQQPAAPKPPVAPAPQPPVAPVPQPEPDYGATTVLDDPNATTVLDASMLSCPKAYLIRKKNGEKIPLTKDFFRIGKEKSFVDYFVSDNTAVSRAHAYIIAKSGEYFIVDTNSTNHTYINGGMIPPNVETRLSHGAKLRLANEDFEFLLH